MIVLVTGGCGFIGLNLVDHLARNAVPVIVADRPENAGELDRLEVAVEFRPLDVTNLDACTDLLREVLPTHVVHGAALTLTDPMKTARTLAVNQAGTANLLTAAIAAGSVERALILSSSGVYAPEAPDPCPETAPVSTEGAYARSKLAAEAMMADVERRGGFPVVAARIGSAYGTHERPRATRPRVTLIQTLLDHLHAGRPLGISGSDYSRDWIHADDVAAALLALLTTARLDHRIYNLSTGIGVSARRIIGHFVERGLKLDLHAPADIVLDPRDSRPALDIARLRHDTGFQPRFDMMRGLDHLIAAGKDPRPMSSLDIKFDRYYTYDEMTERLRALVAAYPDLATLTSLAKSFQGRDVWLLTLTNPQTGPAAEKPGFYIDAQIHAEEHAGSATALYAAWHLLTKYGSDEEATRLLDGQVFYIIPRINPDGAELSLVPPYYNWCGNGRYMPGADRIEGLIPEDIDGDGFIVWMRVPDSRGEWKKSASNPDVMVQRQPGEEGGQYYRLYPEGTIRNYDGVDVPVEKPFDGNMNRNFPTHWSPREYGGGELPLSEPEAAGIARFVLDHPNICGMCAYHTHGGIILRPSMTKPDSAMGARDINLYKEIGKVGTEITGYPTISIYEEFTPDKTKVRRGGLMDWTYEEMGIISMGIELWDLEREAGVEKVGYMNLYPRTVEIQHKVHDYVVEHVGEKGFRPWKSFDHPQLGAVEIGGMVNIWSYRNPPPHLLEEVCRKNAIFNLRHAAAAPDLRVDKVEITPLGAALYKVRVEVSNHGYLPTNLSDVAIDNNVAKPVKVSLSIDGGELLMNPSSVSLGHLAGRTERLYPWSPWGQQWTATAKAVEWLIRMPASGSVTVEASSEKAGTKRVTRAVG